MAKLVTLEMDDETYRLFSKLAAQDNRPLENFIETAAKRYVEDSVLVDEFEMREIEANQALNASLRQGHEDAAQHRGRIVE